MHAYPGGQKQYSKGKKINNNKKKLKHSSSLTFCIGAGWEERMSFGRAQTEGMEKREGNGVDREEQHKEGVVN